MALGTRARRVAATGVAVLASIGLVACSGGRNGHRDAAIIKGLDNPFFQAMADGLRVQAKTDGADVQVQAAASVTDTTGQSSKLTALAGEGFGCYIVNPISGTNLVQGLARLSDKDVPVVNIDSPIDAKAARIAGVDLTTYIGTDNRAAGGKAGREMIRTLGSGRSHKVAMIGGISGDVTSAARLTGFRTAIAGKLTVTQTVAADWERGRALTAAATIMRADPDLEGFFAANDDMGLGIVQAVRAAGKLGKVTVISVDGNQDALRSVAAGQLHATVAQYPYAIGQLGIQACRNATAGRDVPAEVESPTAVVTGSNVTRALARFPVPFEPYDNPLDHD